MSSTTGHLSFSKFIRLSSIWILVLLPFQTFPKTISSKLSTTASKLSIYFTYTDELLIFILLFIFTSWICLRKSKNSIIFFPSLNVFLLFIFSCITGILINHIDIYRGSLAIFDYSKNFLLLFIFYGMNYQYAEFKKALVLFINIGIIVAAIGLLGVILSFVTDSVINVLVREEVRMGFHRVTSVAGPGSVNYIGVYMVLVYWLLYAMKKEFKYVKIKSALLLIFIILTASRSAIVSFLILFFLLESRKKVVAGSISCFFIFAVGYGLDLWPTIPNQGIGVTDGLDYRQATYALCWKYLKINPVWGVGPGMLGGLAVQTLWSPLYSNLAGDTMWFLGRMNGLLDQFWGGLFADIGIVGGSLYLLILATLGRDLLSGSSFFSLHGEKGIDKVGKVLACYILALIFMGFGGGINAALLLCPFLAFSGIYISLYKKHLQHISLSQHLSN